MKKAFFRYLFKKASIHYNRGLDLIPVAIHFCDEHSSIKPYISMEDIGVCIGVGIKWLLSNLPKSLLSELMSLRMQGKLNKRDMWGTCVICPDGWYYQGGFVPSQYEVGDSFWDDAYYTWTNYSTSYISSSDGSILYSNVIV